MMTTYFAVPNKRKNKINPNHKEVFECPYHHPERAWEWFQENHPLIYRWMQEGLTVVDWCHEHPNRTGKYE